MHPYKKECSWISFQAILKSLTYTRNSFHLVSNLLSEKSILPILLPEECIKAFQKTPIDSTKSEVPQFSAVTKKGGTALALEFWNIPFDETIKRLSLCDPEKTASFLHISFIPKENHTKPRVGRVHDLNDILKNRPSIKKLSISHMDQKDLRYVFSNIGAVDRLRATHCSTAAPSSSITINLADFQGTRLSLPKSSLTDCNISLQEAMPKLKELDLSWNRFETLKNVPFHFLSELEILNLSGNAQLYKTPFPGKGSWNNLHTLCIGRTRISDLSLVWNISSLKNLDLSGCRAKTIQGISASRNLQSLNLQNTQIPIPEEIRDLPLQRLYLPDYLKEFPSAVCALENLRFLYANHSQFRKLPHTLSDLKDHLEELHLPDHQLSSFEEIYSLSQLKILNLSITTVVVMADDCLPVFDSIKKLCGLRELYFSNLGLNCAPKGLSFLKELTILDLSHNALRALPSEIEDCQKLVILNVSHNYLNLKNPKTCAALSALKSRKIAVDASAQYSDPATSSCHQILLSPLFFLCNIVLVPLRILVHLFGFLYSCLPL